ncbi:MAG: hypothetical protein LUG56_09340, partial [Lachnospiraceae bacterium]|nr:hypothetical protein [Lachnospiraceae bacterium]
MMGQELDTKRNTRLTVTAYTAITVFLGVLLWEYPAAAILLPVFLCYEAVCLCLFILVKKKKLGIVEYSVRIHSSKYRCMLLTAFTDVFGLAAGEDTYILFDVLCCVDGIAICRDLISRVSIVIVLVRENSLQETTIGVEGIPLQQSPKAWHDLL